MFIEFHEEKPLEYDECFNTLKEATENFTLENVILTSNFREEVDSAKQILMNYYKTVEVSDGRKTVNEPMIWVIAVSDRIPKKKSITYWFTIIGEESDLCGEEFFVEEYTYRNAKKTAEEIFPHQLIKFLGVVSDAEAEIMGLDTY